MLWASVVTILLASAAPTAVCTREAQNPRQLQRLQDAAHRSLLGRVGGFVEYIHRVDEDHSLDKHYEQNEVLPREPRILAGSRRPRPFTGDLDILEYFQDVPYEHWSCCMLGKLAGDKGFSCISDHYSSVLNILRSPNRAHNRRLPNTPNYGHTLMNHFRRCFAQGPDTRDEFRTCCRAGAIQKDDLLRWEQHRNQPRQPVRAK